jgi:hypothetical protein
VNNLALTLSSQGDLAGARKLQEGTLDIGRRVLGPEHLLCLFARSSSRRVVFRFAESYR